LHVFRPRNLLTTITDRCNDEQVPKPNRAEHEKALAAIDAELDKLKAERQKIQAQVDAALDKSKNTALGKARDELSKLRSKKGKLIDEKKAIRTQLEAAKSEADKIMKDRKDTKSSIKFTNFADIDKEIKRLQHIQETTSISLSEEKQIIKEIDALKSSKQAVETLAGKDSAMDDAKAQRKDIGTLISEKDKEIDEVSKEIDEKQTAMKALNDTDSAKRDKLQGWFTERDELRAKFGEKLKEKDAIRDAFRKAMNDWYNASRALRAQKKIQYDEEKKVRDAEQAEYLKKVEEEEAKKVPYEAEQALCEYLADYLTKMYLTDEAPTAAENKKEETVIVRDDPFANFKPIKKNDDEIFFGKGKGKKKRERANKKQVQKSAAPFVLSVDTFGQFGLIGLNPPTTLAQVENSVKELREKKEWYSKQPRGSVPTANDIRKANEKEAQKLQQNNNGKTGGGTKASGGKVSGNFSLSDDDFAPLPGASLGSTAPVSQWGKSNNGVAPPTTKKSSGPDPTPEEAAQQS